MGSLTYNTTFAFVATPDAPLAGRWPITDGFFVSNAGAVVNELSKLPSEFPDRSFTTLVATTAMVLVGGRVPLLSVTTRLSSEVLICTDARVPFTTSPIVLLLMVVGSNDFENVNTTIVSRPIPIAPLFGVTEITRGGVVSPIAAVVNEELKIEQHGAELPA